MLWLHYFRWPVGHLSTEICLTCCIVLQRCSNILTHTCISSDGQSGSGMWDDAFSIRAVLTGKVRKLLYARVLLQALPYFCSCFAAACVTFGTLFGPCASLQLFTSPRLIVYEVDLKRTWSHSSLHCFPTVAEA